MTRLLTTIAAAVLLSFAFAQGPGTPLVRAFAMVAAMEMDATMIDCPTSFEVPSACFVHSLGVAWAQMDWDALVREFGDVQAMTPWEVNGNITSRLLEKTTDPRMFIAVLLADWNTHDALVVVLHLDDPQ